MTQNEILRLNFFSLFYKLLISEEIVKPIVKI